MIHAFPMWNAHLEPGRRALAQAGEFIRRQLQRETGLGRAIGAALPAYFA